VGHFFELSPPTLEHYFSWRTIEIKHFTLELIIILTFYTWINNYIIAIFLNKIIEYYKLNKLTLRSIIEWMSEKYKKLFKPMYNGY
jgi:hypothetical protein